jgi:ferritin-like protein
MSEQDKLVAAVKAEHAAIYAYGVLGARLDQNTVAFAVDAEAAHRRVRDAAAARLTALNVTPPGPEPGYLLPTPVTDQASALALAVEVEQRAAAVWREALPATTGDDRRLALTALVDGAVRATKARTLAGVRPVTVALPGT